MTSARMTGRRMTAAIAVACCLGLGGVAQGQIKISQVYGGGNNQGSEFTADYIELVNTGGASVNFATTNYSIHYRAAAGTSWTKVTINAGVIPAGGYYLIRTIAAGTAYLRVDLPTPDLTATSPDMSATAGVLALYDAGTTVLVGSSACPPAISSGGGTLQDLIGWGSTATCSEPTGAFASANNAEAPDARHAAFRRVCGSGDGNNNGSDFFVGVPNPRNTSIVSPVLGTFPSAWASGSPSDVRAGDSTLIVAIPRNCTGGRILGYAPGTDIWVNLTAIGGSATQALYDDGTNGDEVSGDGIYSYLAAVPGGTATGTKSMQVFLNPGVAVCYASIAVTANSGPTNDACRSASAIAPTGTPGTANSYGAAGVTVAGNFTSANEEYNANSSNFISTSGFISMNGSSGGKRGLWYTVIGTGTTMTAETCTTVTSFDSIIQVMCGSCDGVILAGAGDDDCPTSLSRASWCSTSGQIYYIWVSPFSSGAQTNAFNLKVTDNGTACATQRPCTVCSPTCPGGSTIENETNPGPSTNDGCDATSVAGGTAQVFTDVTVGSSALNICGTSRALGAGSSTSGTVDNDWYRFQAASSDSFSATCTAQFPVSIQLRQLSGTGTCSTNTLVSSGTADRCGIATISSSVTAGNWYALKVTPNFSTTAGVATNNFSGFWVGATSNAYTLSMLVGAPPANDVCGANVASFTIPGAGGTASGSSNNATDDAGLPSSACPAGSKDVWHYFTPTTSGNYLVSTCGSSYDTILNVYSGACGALTELGCNDDTTQCTGGTSEVRVNLSAATLYRIRIASKSGSTGAYTISVQPSPVNDDCAAALDLNTLCSTAGLFNGAKLQQSNANATTDGTASCATSSRDLWYKFNPAVSGVWTIETCGTGATIDTVLSLYDACGGTQLDCNDDAAVACTSAAIHSRISPTLSTGTTYWLRVATKGTSAGGLILFSLIPPSVVQGNDVCAAIPDPAYTIPSTGGSAIGDLRSANSEGNAASSCQSGTGQKDEFFYFTPTGSCTWNFSTCGCYDVDTAISIHTACPTAGANNQLAPTASTCADQGCSSGNLSFLSGVSLTAGTPYIIRVAMWSSSGTPGPFVLTVSQGPPVNDTCANATSVTVTGGSATVTGSSECATDDTPTPSCTGTSSHDVWWTFTTGAAQAGLWQIDTCGSAFDTVLTVYSGACASLTELPSGCNDNAGGSPCASPQSAVTVSLAASTTYKVRVSSHSPGGAITLNINFLAPPANDACATPTAIASAGTGPAGVSGTSVAATLDGPSPACGTPVDRDVWFSFNPACSGKFDISLCTSSYDTVLELWSACPPGGTVVACNDDDATCGGGTRSRILGQSLTSGTTYLIRVMVKGNPATGGSYNLVVVPSTPANDVCAGVPDPAFTIPGSGGSVTGNLAAANSEGNAASSCQSGTGQKDLFYYFTPSSSCPWKFSTCGVTPDVDTIISIHTACPTAGSNNQLSTDCVDQGCASGNESEATYSNLVAGTPYIVRVAMWSSTATPGCFTLNVTPSAPANDACSGAISVTVTSGTGNATGDNTCATDDGLTPSCGATSKDLWWTFTTGAAQAGNWRIKTCGSAIDTVLTVYTGPCATLAEVAGGCNDDAGTGTCSGSQQSEVLVSLAASTQYWVRVASKGASAGGAITLNLQAEIPPPNDDCTAATAISISGNCLTGTAAGSNEFAAAALDGAQPPMCVTASKDVFYTVTIPASPAGTNNWIFDTCTSTTQDTVLQVLSACGGADLGCNDDTAGCGSGTQSKVTVSLLAGAIVKVRVASKGAGATGGTFTLTVTLAAPANDLCSAAQPVSEGSWPWYNHCATTDGIGWTASTAPPAGCDATDTATNANSDVWFLYTATCTATTTVDTCGTGSLSDTVLVVYPVGVCPPPNASKLACDDDFDAPDTCATGGTLRSVLHFAATKGTQYLIRVGSFSGTTQGSGTLNISQPADTTPPTITLCAGDQNGTADTNCQAAVPDFTAGVTATDNCLGTLTVQQSPTAGTLVGLGDNVITITVKDAANNTSAPCTAHFFVSDTTAPNISQCAGNQVGSADANCQAAVPDFTAGVTATDNCTASGSLVITQTPTAGTLVGLGATVVTVHVKDAANNESTCQAMFTVSDTTAPSIADCPSDIGPVPTDLGQPTAVVSWTAPTASDNCNLVSFTSTHNPGDAFPVGVTSVTYTATDGAGLMSTCVFSVTVVDNESPTIHDCPKTITVDADDGACSKTVSWTEPTATDNQPGVSIVQTEGPAPGSSFPVGTTHIKYTATDVSSNTATCEFDVIVVDNQDPQISGCPGNISLGTEAPNCSAVATWTAPTASDNCAIQSFVSTHSSGDTFPLGMTVVTYTATDVHGRTATCNFTVTVSDDDAPTIATCASNQSASADANCQAMVPDFTGGVSASDNCTASGSLVITQSPTAGTLVGLGPTNVTITVKDAANNSAMCNATFTVNDTTPPSIVGCPANITSNTNAPNCAAVVSWTPPTTTDNCGASISRTQGPAPGSTFANGSTTTIEYTATDGTNSTVCSFTVQVVATPDVNNDTVVNASGDLGPFIQVLLGLDVTPLHVYRSDTNCDGVVNGRDIPGMVDALIP